MRNGDYNLVVAPESYPGTRYRRRYCYEHHLVWWTCTGEQLLDTDCIHHKNGDKRDNRFENLVKMSRADHARHHAPGAKMDILICGWCRKHFKRSHRSIGAKLKQGRQEFFCSRACGTKKQWADGRGKGGGDLKHGTVSCYSYSGCRCDACKKAKREAMSAWRATRKH